MYACEKLLVLTSQNEMRHLNLTQVQGVVGLGYRRMKESGTAKDMMRPPKVSMVLVLHSNP